MMAVVRAVCTYVVTTLTLLYTVLLPISLWEHKLGLAGIQLVLMFVYGWWTYKCWRWVMEGTPSHKVDSANG